MKEPFAVFTIVKDEPTWLPIWVNYYHQHVAPEHIYILNHDSTGDGLTMLDGLAAAFGVNVIPVHRHMAFDHAWLCKTVSRFHEFLLSSYEAVLFTEADEIVTPAPDSPYDNLVDYARNVLTDQREFVRCFGHEVVHSVETEPVIDWSQRPLLGQRNWWYFSDAYSKPVMSSIPMYWEKGFHRASNVPPLASLIDRNLLLIHLHKLDFEHCVYRHQHTAAQPWNEADKTGSVGWQNRMTDEGEIRTWFKRSIDDPEQDAVLSRIPDAVRKLV